MAVKPRDSQHLNSNLEFGENEPFEGFPGVSHEVSYGVSLAIPDHSTTAGIDRAQREYSRVVGDLSI